MAPARPLRPSFVTTVAALAVACGGRTQDVSEIAVASAGGQAGQASIAGSSGTGDAGGGNVVAGSGGSGNAGAGNGGSGNGGAGNGGAGNGLGGKSPGSTGPAGSPPCNPPGPTQVICPSEQPIVGAFCQGPGVCDFCGTGTAFRCDTSACNYGYWAAAPAPECPAAGGSGGQTGSAGNAGSGGAAGGDGGAAGGGGLGSAGASGSPGGTAGSTGSSGASGSGGTAICDALLDKVFVADLTRPDGTIVACAGPADTETSTTELEGILVGQTEGQLEIDACPPGNDCDSAVSVLHVSEPLPALGLGRYLAVKVRITDEFGWACSVAVSVSNLPSFGGTANPLDATDHLLFAGADGTVQTTGLPFSITKEAVCERPSLCGTFPAVQHSLRFNSAAGEALVAQGTSGPLLVADGTMAVRNLRSFETGCTDSYWDWAWTATRTAP
jgi:hypothetical protein